MARGLFYFEAGIAAKEPRVVRNWERVRKLILKRDDFTCQKCRVRYYYKKDRSRLLLHHMDPIYDDETIQNPNRLITVCHKCHVKYFDGGCSGWKKRKHT